MPDRSLTDQQILAMLAAAPPRIAELTAGLTAAQLHAAPAAGEWPVNQILAHLRACADVWGGCIADMLAHDRPTLRAINPRAWVKRTDYGGQAFEASLRAFAEQRADLLATLQPLAPDAWVRSATVTGAGRPLERTVRFYTEWLAVHERSHLKPIERAAQALRGE